jgi:hypothetical protein
VENLKYIQNVGGRLYFRRTYLSASGKQTVRVRLPAITSPEFDKEYQACLGSDLTARKRKRKGVFDEVDDLLLQAPASKPHLYIIQSGETGPVKIGKSTNVHNRRRTIQTAQPYRMRVIAIGKELGRWEPDFHYALASCSMAGEWFSWSAKVIRAVEILRSGVEITDDEIEALIHYPDPVPKNDGWEVGTNPCHTSNALKKFL